MTNKYYNIKDVDLIESEINFLYYLLESYFQVCISESKFNPKSDIIKRVEFLESFKLKEKLK